MPILSTKIYINDELELEVENAQIHYEVTSTGLSYSYDTPAITGDWTYTGTGTFLGFSTTQGATTPDEYFAVGDQYGFAVGNDYYLYPVEAAQSTGSMYIGNLNISKMYIGNAEVSKVYLGQDLVYEKQAPTPSEYSVTITFQNGIDNDWFFTKIYDEFQNTSPSPAYYPTGNLIGQIMTEDGTITVTTTTGKISIVAHGGSLVSGGTFTYTNATAALEDHMSDTILLNVNITGNNATVVVDGVTWDD